MTDSLLSRLQALTEPSREIDAEIALANGWTYIKCGDLRLWSNSDGPGAMPHYTGSIDAALTLVPRGAIWICGGHVRAYWADVSGYSGSGPTPAIALLIAIRSMQEESKP